MRSERAEVFFLSDLAVRVSCQVALLLLLGGTRLDEGVPIEGWFRRSSERAPNNGLLSEVGARDRAGVVKAE